MPHYTNASVDSNYSLDVDVGAMAASGFHTGPVGTAVSPTSWDRDDRKQLPSSLTMEERRRSSVADAYNDLMGGNPNHIDSLSNGNGTGTGTVTPAERASRRSSRTSVNGRYRSQYLEDQFVIKDLSVSGARDRVQKESPVIAELRTNVIVSAFKTPWRADKAAIEDADGEYHRLRMSSHWSQTSHITSPSDTADRTLRS